MKRIAVSLYNFLDQDNDNRVSFEQLMYRTIPGLRAQDYQVFEGWIREERDKETKCVLNYRDHNMAKNCQVINKELNFTQIKDFLYIFTLLDKDNDGLLSFEEMRDAFKDQFSQSQIENYFDRYDDNKARQLNIEEFLKMMAPRDHFVTKGMLEN